MNETTRRPGQRGIALPYLRAWREFRVMSTTMLAQASGVTLQTILNYENARTSARALKVRQLAAALDITPEQLVFEEPPIPMRRGA